MLNYNDEMMKREQYRDLRREARLDRLEKELRHGEKASLFTAVANRLSAFYVALRCMLNSRHAARRTAVAHQEC